MGYFAARCLYRRDSTTRRGTNGLPEKRGLDLGSTETRSTVSLADRPISVRSSSKIYAVLLTISASFTVGRIVLRGFKEDCRVTGRTQVDDLSRSFLADPPCG